MSVYDYDIDILCFAFFSVGYKLEYDHDGAITSQSPIARQCGTTVILKNLFKTLPVRHKELKKNIKKVNCYYLFLKIMVC